MTDLQSQQTPSEGTTENSLKKVLSYILTPEGLEQNLDIALNMNDGGEVSLQLIMANSNVSKQTKNFQEVVQVQFPLTPGPQRNRQRPSRHEPHARHRARRSAPQLSHRRQRPPGPRRTLESQNQRVGQQRPSKRRLTRRSKT